MTAGQLQRSIRSASSRGVTQATMATTVGCAQSQISKWARGLHDPGDLLSGALCRIIDRIGTGQKEHPRMSHEHRALTHKDWVHYGTNLEPRDFTRIHDDHLRQMEDMLARVRDGGQFTSDQITRVLLGMPL